ncbi:hypothetical protein M9H77_27110 [Catharanthus roseus]|uniref:Uncharacterized protein n=1 Tax=Catharanthus roseus TaxID=4058 RepID=A0ACC0ABJ8_CATRO|nr:hypothetical protein M9H77_27110 [Catharanthus roseus]
MLGRCTLDLDPVDRGCGTVEGLGPRNPVSRGTQVPYPAAVDLAEGGTGYHRWYQSSRFDTSFDISFDYGMLCVSYICKLKMSGPYSPSHGNEAISENSHHGLTDTAREVSHHSEPTSH